MLHFSRNCVALWNLSNLSSQRIVMAKKIWQEITFDYSNRSTESSYKEILIKQFLSKLHMPRYLSQKYDSEILTEWPGEKWIVWTVKTVTLNISCSVLPWKKSIINPINLNDKRHIQCLARYIYKLHNFRRDVNNCRNPNIGGQFPSDLFFEFYKILFLRVWWMLILFSSFFGIYKRLWSFKTLRAMCNSQI